MTEDKHEDFEGCFSVENLAGPVKRYKTIQYKAYTPAGEPVEGVAHGFLARIIQHEVDHLNGTLCITLVPKDKIERIDEYRRRRAEAMGKDIDQK
jgi:peptide deformylase